jgi:hypothetical protein
MRSAIPVFTAVLLTLSTPAAAAVITFNTDPFAGSAALITPGRQVVGGEPSITFDIATDVFSFDAAVFGIDDTVSFANALAPNLPATGLNIVVLQTLDNDANPATPFGAGNAADLIAAQITSAGPGFFIYFNSMLNLPRLVYSTDLSENTSDLQILARITNLTGQSSALSTFESDNFQIVPAPEPTSLALVALAASMWGGARSWRRCRRRD